MTHEELSALISRVQTMEHCFDSLLQAEKMGRPADSDLLHQLLDYYEGGQWLRDYELDEQGGLPTGLKRGVLSQDGVFNLLARICPATEAEDGTS